MASLEENLQKTEFGFRLFRKFGCRLFRKVLFDLSGCGVFEKPKMQHEKNRLFWGVDIFTKWLRNLFVPVDGQ